MIKSLLYLTLNEGPARLIKEVIVQFVTKPQEDAEVLPACLLYTSPSPRDATLSRMPSSA